MAIDYDDDLRKIGDRIAQVVDEMLRLSNKVTVNIDAPNAITVEARLGHARYRGLDAELNQLRIASGVIKREQFRARQRETSS
jgi:hypothetical protein